jgi:hypothetical protein
MVTNNKPKVKSEKQISSTKMELLKELIQGYNRRLEIESTTLRHMIVAFFFGGKAQERYNKNLKYLHDLEMVIMGYKEVGNDKE